MEIYHYTSLNALMGILQGLGSIPSRHEKDLCFWGSRFDCMNDAIDCQFALQLPEQILKKIKPDYSHPPRTVYPYVVSFCKKEDYLSMWRLYSSYVCLKFDKDVLEKSLNGNDTILHDCKYSKNNIDDIANSYKELFTENVHAEDEDIWTNAQCAASFIKHNSFEEEQECRLVHFRSSNKTSISIKGSESPIQISEDTSDLCFRTEGNRLVPFHKFYLPAAALKGIIVREYDEDTFKRVKAGIKLVLQQRNIEIKDKEIVQSSACRINK
jgi:hypothetical protein